MSDRGRASGAWRRAAMVAAAASLAASTAVVSAQFGFGRFSIRMAPKDLPDRKFTICRLMYTSVRAEADGAGWRTDYQDGDNHLLIRFSELTRTPVSKDDRRSSNHWVVRITDDALFNCPCAVAADVGT